MNALRKAATLGVAAFIFSVTPAAVLGQSGRHPALIFTGIANPDSLDNYAMGYRAVIFVYDRAAWRMIYLPRQFENAGWVYAGRVRGRADVWAVAQFGRGDIGPDLEIAHSADDGRTWRHLHSLPKVSRHATFHSFSMTRNGRGSLTVQLEDNIEPGHRGGYYTYTTTNGGRTWSRNPRRSEAAPPTSDGSMEPIPLRAQFTTGIPCSEP
jgi:hypothetical protein